MKKYIFKTTTTMKQYNNKKWWIDGGVITEKRIAAENLNEAIVEYVRRVENEHYITISRNAIKNKEPIYIDTKNGEPKQTGYILTGKSDFQYDSGEFSAQYIDLWIDIITTVETDFQM